MKIFRYRLERILSLKGTLKKQAQKEFAKAETELQRQRLILTNLKTELAGRLQLEKARRRKRLDLRHLDLTQKYLGQLSFMIGYQNRAVAQAENRTDEKRKKLVEASREKQKYERLKEIRKEEYVRDLELFLQKETDEFAKNIHLQNKGLRKNLI